MSPDAAATQDAPRATPDLDDSSLFFNREISWLDFNDRVLQLAADSRLPLLERVKFCAIHTSNLDEYFMVRVAGLHDQLDAGIDTPGTGRAHAAADAGCDSREGCRPGPAPGCLPARRPVPGAGRARYPHRALRRSPGRSA